jgi:hypothetical protein
VDEHGRVRRLLVLTVFVLGMLVAPPALAQSDDGRDEPVTTTTAGGGDIIPRPNTGVEPEDPGDRGGALQSVLFVGIVGGIVLIGALVVRQSRRARAERGF